VSERVQKTNNKVAQRAAPCLAVLALLSLVSPRVEAQTYNCSWVTTTGTTSWFTPGSWSSCNSTSPDNGGGNTYNATIAVSGTYTITVGSPVTVGSLTLDDSGATLSNSSTITATNGVTLTAGTIAGGTIVGTGGTGGTTAVALSGTSATGTLNGVTLDGSLDITGEVASAYITNGITLTGTGGTGAGTINITGESAALEIAPTTTALNDVTINMGSSSGGTFLYAGYEGAGTLTLGANTNLISSGGTGTDYITQSSTASVVNEGSISVSGTGHTLDITPNAFTNNGTITGANGTTLAVGGLSSSTSSLVFTNSASGTVTMNGTGGATTLEIGEQGNPGDIPSYEWTNAGTIDLTDTDLKLGGYFKTSDIGTLNVSGGSEQLYGYLDNSGSTLTVSSGSLSELSMEDGTIHGGVIQSGSGNLFGVTSAHGTLDAVQLDGPLNITGEAASAYISNGITLTGTGGTGAGTINITGESAALEIAPTTTALNDDTINMGSSSGGTFLYAGYEGAGTLTLGANTNLISSGGTGTDYITQSSTASVVNEGSISVSGTGHALDITPNAFTNDGTITGANGTTLAVGGLSSSTSSLVFTNSASGTVTMNGTGGATTLEIGEQGNPGDTPSYEWTNAGTIDLTDTDLKLGGYIKTSDIGTLDITGGSEQLLGYLDNSGSTLNVASGELGELSMQGGTIHSGLIQGGSGNLFAVTSAYGTLDAVQINGPLNITGEAASAYITNGITATGTGGTGAGTINVTGESAALEIAPTTTALNDVTINMGASSGGTFLYAGYEGAGTLTLGANTNLISSGGTGTDYITQSSTASVVNEGSISVSGTGHALDITPNSFTNDGTITGANGTTLAVGGPSSSTSSLVFTNSASGTVTMNGTGGATTLEIGEQGNPGDTPSYEWTNAGTIDLTDTDLKLGGYFKTSDIGTLNVSGGSEQLYGYLDNSGSTLTVSSGSLSELSMEDGTIHGGVIQSGSGNLFGVTSAYGTLDAVQLDGPLNITGEAASAYITNGITLTGTGGTGAGTINLTGESAALEIGPTTTTLDNLTINMGVSGGGSTFLYAGYEGAGTLTLGANANLISSGGAGTDYITQSSTASVMNEGSISVADTGHTLYINPNSFTNSGTVTAESSGTLELQSVTFTNFSGGTLTGGTYQAESGGTIILPDNEQVTTLAANVLLSGAGSTFETFDTSTSAYVPLESSLTTIASGGSLQILADRNYTTTNAITNQGTLGLGGGTFSSASLTNSGTLEGFGTVTPSITNTGTINATGGTLTASNGIQGTTGTITVASGAGLTTGAASNVGTLTNAGTVTSASGNLDAHDGIQGTSGTLIVASGGTVTLGAASTVGTLTNDGTSAGALALGSSNITVSSDYTNASFGSGNAFNSHANVSGTGEILAAGTPGMSLTGTDISAGGGVSNTTATLNVGNVRVGNSTSGSFDINNVNAAGGPALRGAVESADLTTPGLSVTGASYGPIAVGASAAESVTYTPTQSGALTGQTFTVATNFDNVGAKTVTVTGAAYQAAVGQLNNTVSNPNNFNFGVIQVGQSVTSNALSVSNVATGAAGYVEDLNAGFGAVGANTGTGTASVTGNGSITGLLAGATNTSAMTVTVQGTTAGTYNGDIAVDFQTAGTVNGVSDGLGTASVGSADYGISGTITGEVVNEASPLINNPTISLGNVHVGGTFGTATVSLTNQATTAPQAALDASISGTAPVTGSGTVTLLAPGSTDDTSLTVGIGNTTTAGKISGTATVGLVSDASNQGCTSGCTITLPSQTVTVSGGVYQYAQPSVPSTVSLGNFRVGSGGSQAITIGNTLAAPAGYQEGLDVATGTTSAGVTASGSITNLAAGSTSSAITVAMSAVAAGVNSGTATVDLTSDGTIDGLASTTLTPQTVNVTATGYNLAAGSATPSPITIANQRVGGGNSQALTVSNTGPAGSYTEVLNANFGTNTGNATSSGAIAGGLGAGGVAAGASNDTAMSVGVDTSTSGAKSGTVTVDYVSNGTGTSGLGNTSVGSQTLTVSGNVYQAAVGQLNNTVSNPNNFNFGVIQVGQSVTSNALSVSNVATGAAGYVEDLNAGFGAVGANTGTGTASVTGNGSITGLLAGATNTSAMTVTVQGTTAGTYNGDIAVDFQTAGTVNGVSDGLGTASVGSADYGISGTITGEVVNEASPLINNPTISLGNVHVGGTFGTATVSLTNQATTAPQAALDASISGTAPVTGSGTVTLLAPGSTDDTSLTVGIGNTTTAGKISGTATVGLVSDASNQGCTSGCTITLPSQTVTVSGGVYQYAQPSVPSTVSLGNFRVGSGGSQAITIGNTLAAPAGYQEGLDVATGATSAGVTASGSISNLAAGSTSSGITVGMSSVAAGVNTGTATLALTSNGAIDGLASTPLAPQTVNVTASGYEAAQGALNNTVSNPSSFSFGTIQVGQSVTSSALSVSNVASGPSGYVEDLNASFGSVAANTGTGAATVTGNGAITGLAAGGTDSSSMTVTVQGTTAGTYDGGIAVNFYTAGTVKGVSDGLGVAQVGSADYGLTGTIQASVTVVNDADPVINNPTISLGNVRQGSTSPTGYVSLTNQSTTAPQAALDASISSTTPVTSSGAITLLAPGSTNSAALAVGIDTSTAGAVSGTATVGLVSDASNIGGCSPNCQMTLPSQSVTVSGDVYRVASPTLNTPSVTLAARVGDASPTATVSVTNTSPDPYTEGLAASMASAPTGWSNSGAITNLAAGGTDGSTLKVALNTSTPGVFSGPQTVNFTSNGEIDNATPESVGSGSVTLEGSVYTPAVQQVNTTSVNFGVVHVGSVVGPQTVSVTNAAGSTALNDVLTGTLTGGSGPFSASGNLGAGVAAGQTDATNLTVSFNTSAAGVYTGSAQFTGASHDSQLADLQLGSTTVVLSGQVNNYANAAFALDSGSGSLSKSGSNYVLNLGNITQGASVDSLLSLVNQVTGPADDLEGSFSAGTLTDASLSGANWSGSFSGIGAGESLAGLGIDFSTGSLGSFDDTILLNGMGYYDGATYGAYADDITLTLEGDVVKVRAVPEIDPANATAALTLLAGLLAIAGGRRRRIGVQ
jgi:hypothetical protein